MKTLHKDDKDFIPFITLLARVNNAGELLGCTADLIEGVKNSFWRDVFESDLYVNDAWLEFDIAPMQRTQTFEIKVPEDMYLALIHHGTLKQVYPDGYEAWKDVIRYGTINLNVILSGGKKSGE